MKRVMKLPPRFFSEKQKPGLSPMISPTAMRATRLTEIARIVVAVVCLTTFASCKKSDPLPPPPAAANPVNPDAPADAQEKARVAQAAAFRAGVEPPPPALELRGGEPATPEVIAAYNQLLAREIFKQRDGPETMDELVRKWPLPRLPTPPPGKRIIYDAVNRIIKLDPP